MITPLHATSNFFYYMLFIGSAWTEKMIDTWATLSTGIPELFMAAVDTPLAAERSSPIDNQKPDLISTLTDEFCTSLTSLRAASEILHDNPQLDPVQRQQFLSIILKENEKLTQVVNQTLTLLESRT